MHRRIPSRIEYTVVSVVILAVALVGVACGAAPVAPPTAQQIFDRAAHSAMKDAKVALTGQFSTSASGMTMTGTISGNGELVAQPVRSSHLALKMDIASPFITGTVTGDIIEVSGKRYTKTESNFTGMPSDNASKYTVEDVPASTSPLLPTHATNLTVVGQESIRGDMCWHVRGTETTDAQGTPVAAGTTGATTLHVDAWVRERDYYYVRVKMDGLAGLGAPTTEPSASGTPTPTSATIQADLSDYDRGITISPPPADQISGTLVNVGDRVKTGGGWSV